MKRLLTALLILGVMAGIAGASDVYKAGPVITTAVFTGEANVYQSVYLPQYKQRTFIVSVRPTNGSITSMASATLECSIDGTRYSTVDASSLATIPMTASSVDTARNQSKMVRIENNPAPYWRILAATPTHSAIVRVMTMMSN